MRETIRNLAASLPPAVRLLDLGEPGGSEALRGLAMLRGARGDRVHAGSGIIGIPGQNGFTLFRLSDDPACRRAAGYLTARLDRMGRDTRTHLKLIITDVRDRGRGVASELADGLAGMSAGFILGSWKDDPHSGFPGHHLVYQAISRGGERICARLEATLHDRIGRIAAPLPAETRIAAWPGFQLPEAIL